MAGTRRLFRENICGRSIIHIIYTHRLRISFLYRNIRSATFSDDSASWGPQPVLTGFSPGDEGGNFTAGFAKIFERFGRSRVLALNTLGNFDIAQAYCRTRTTRATIRERLRFFGSTTSRRPPPNGVFLYSNTITQYTAESLTGATRARL